MPSRLLRSGVILFRQLLKSCKQTRLILDFWSSADWITRQMTLIVYNQQMSVPKDYRVLWKLEKIGRPILMTQDRPNLDVGIW